MAAKDLAIGNKRKASGDKKGKSDGKVKKAKLEEVAEPEEAQDNESDDFESFSDSDDGGVKLGQNRSHKQFKKNDDDSNGKTFERGMLTFPNLCAASPVC